MNIIDWTDEQARQAEINRIVTSRLARQEASLLSGLGFDSVDDAKKGIETLQTRIKDLETSLKDNKEKVKDTEKLSSTLAEKEQLIADLEAKFSNLQATNTRMAINTAVTAAAREAGFRKDALDDVLLYAGQRDYVTLSEEGQVAGVDKLIEELKDKKAFWLETKNGTLDYSGNDGKKIDDSEREKILKDRVKINL